MENEPSFTLEELTEIVTIIQQEMQANRIKESIDRSKYQRVLDFFDTSNDKLRTRIEKARGRLDAILREITTLEKDLRKVQNKGNENGK